MSHRLEKVNELIKQELGQILLREEDFGQGVLVTILKVDTAQDLKTASVILSIFPSNKRQQVMKKISAHVGSLHHSLLKKLKMHPVPRLHFVLNEDEEESQKIEGILRDLKKEE